MAPHITTGGDIIPPVSSSITSIVSVESILSESTKKFIDIDENLRAANSRIKWIDPQVD
jgi:hypothetical protein